MFDTSKLKGRIIEMYGTQGAFAKAIDRTDTYVSLVLKGKAYPDNRLNTEESLRKRQRTNLGSCDWQAEFTN